MKSEKYKIEVDEFEALGFDKNSQVYKDTKQQIDSEIDMETNTTKDKLNDLQKNEKALIEKANKVRSGLKNDTANELAKIDIGLQVSQLDPFEIQLNKFISKHENTVYDLTIAKDMKKAKSDSYEIAKVVSSLDKKYSEIAEPINQLRQLLLSKRKSIKDDLREVQDRIKTQIQKHEQAIKEHEEMLLDKLNYIRKFMVWGISNPISSDYQLRLLTLKNLVIDESYEHLQQEAETIKAEVLTELQNLYDAKLQQEKDAAELEELRKLKAENEQKERDALIAKEAAENARLEAERQAQAKIDAINAEAARLKQERENEKAEAERKHLEQIENAKQEAIRAEQEKAQAIENERLRVEREQEAERLKADQLQALEDAKKAKQSHRAKIHKEAKQSIIDNGIGEDIAVSIISLIKDGLIKNVTINY